MAVLRCTQSFACNDVRLGHTRVVAAGALVDDGDLVVKGRESMFEPVESVVERATALSRKRGGRGRKAAAPAVEPAPEVNDDAS